MASSTTFTNATASASSSATASGSSTATASASSSASSNVTFVDYGTIIPTKGEPKAEFQWIMAIVIAATMACTLAMAADAFRGFRFKKLWFPSKYFSLNAISLTLLGLAVKPIADINKGFTFTAGFFSKLNSLIFMSVTLGNFTSSLGLMTDDEILANVVALGVIVVKTISSALIQLINLWPDIFIGYIIILQFETVFVLLLLATLVSSALTVSTIKGRMEAKYQDKHKDAVGKEDSPGKTEVSYDIQVQKNHMMKYFVMAETSCPQFVMARSVVSTTSALITLLATIMLPLSFFQLLEKHQTSPFSYEGFIIWITIIQLVGVIVGMFAPTLRWYVAVSFRRATWNRDSFEKGFKIEDHWIQTLLDWKNNSALPVRPKKSTRYAHSTRGFALAFCIDLQKSIVLFSKFLVFISGLIVSLFRFKSSEGNTYRHDDLDKYVLLLEGEETLPEGILDNICYQAEILILKGRKEQPKSLIKLLTDKFIDFEGVGQFDTNDFRNLQSQAPHNCWTLPVVTLTSIALALPNVAKDKVKELVSPVSEGFSLAKFVDESMDEDATLANFRKAAKVSWVGVVFYNKLLGMDLKKASFESENAEQVFQKLKINAESIVRKFEEKKDPVMKNPQNWPAEVVAANSMCRVCQTMLSSGNKLSNDQWFDKLSVMIVGILAACLTNLPRSITKICHINEIEKRGKSVRKAFHLLGKTEEVVKFLQDKVRPSLDDQKAASIKEWRACVQQNNGDAASMA